MGVQELQAGCRSAQAKHVQRGSLASQQSFVSWLANNHPGWEALLLPLMNAAPSAKLLHKQCQLALTAAKVKSALQDTAFPSLSRRGTMDRTRLPSACSNTSQGVTDVPIFKEPSAD